MVRISKLTDYGIVIMVFFANMPDQVFQAREISHHTHLALPTVSKLLKLLTKSRFLISSRGTTGGYQFARSPASITVADLIRALEGPIAITECNLGNHRCATESICAVRTPWLHINQVILRSLTEIKLSDLVTPTPRLKEPMGAHYGLNA